MLATVLRERAALRAGLEHPLPEGVARRPVDAKEQLLGEMERLLHGGDPADDDRIFELAEELLLHKRSEAAEAMGDLQVQTVRMLDDLAARWDEVKFELSAEQRAKIEEFLDPYREGMREEMLSELPIEERRALEEEQRQREGRDAQE